MRTDYVPKIAISAVIATSLGYLINQLPPIPDVPGKNELIIICVLLLIILSVVVTIWQIKEEAQKSSRTAQSISPQPFNNRQFTKNLTPSNSRSHLSRLSNIQCPTVLWKPLFILCLLHFCPATLLSFVAPPDYNYLSLAGILSGTLAVAWVWTWILTWAWTSTGPWIGALIVLLSGAGWWALFLVMPMLIVWLLNAVVSRSNSWSWYVAVVLVEAGALFLAQAWPWIWAVTIAIALASAASKAREELEMSCGEFQVFLILGLDSVFGMALGGFIGWSIRNQSLLIR